MKIKHKKKFLLTAAFIIIAFLSTGSTIHAEETTNLEIGETCLLSSQCKTGVCETSALSTSPNKFCVCNTGQHCKDKYGQTTADEVWTCSPGNTQSSNLHFCDSNKRESQMPATPEQAAAGTSSTSTETPADVEIVNLTAPKINIPIPTLESFSQMQVAPGEEINVPYMAEYIIALYKYSIVIGSILAVMMLMIGGIMYMMGGMNATLISQSKKIIVGAISGIVILLSSYLMLNIINPNLTQLESITIDTVPAIEFPDEPATGMSFSATETATMAAITASHPNLLDPGQFGARNTSATCTPENVISLAKTYSTMKICFGPCHCASTVFRILRGSNCVSSASGGAARGVTVLDRVGWTTEPCSSFSWNKLPVGYLYRSGHAMLSIGGGRLVESSGKIYNCWDNPRLLSTCTQQGNDAYDACREAIRARTKTRADYCELMKDDFRVYGECQSSSSTRAVCKMYQNYEFDTCAINNGQCPKSGPRSIDTNYCSNCSKIPTEAPHTCRFNGTRHPVTNEGCKGGSSCRNNQCLYESGSSRVRRVARHETCTITYKTGWENSGNVTHSGSVTSSAGPDAEH